MYTAVGALHHVLVGFDGICLFDTWLATPRVAFNNSKHDDAKNQQ